MKTFLIALAMLAGTAAQASAADPIGKGDRDRPLIELPEQDARHVWNGLYVALGVGYAQGDLYFDDYVDSLFATSTPLVTGRVGYDVQRGNFVVGALGEASYLMPSMLGESLDDNGIDANYQLCGGARAGLAVGNSLGYVAGGYCWVPVDGDALGDIEIDLSGPFAGLGFEHQVGGGVSVGLEGRYTWLSDEVEGIEINHDDLSVRLMLSKHF